MVKEIAEYFLKVNKSQKSFLIFILFFSPACFLRRKIFVSNQQ